MLNYYTAMRAGDGGRFDSFRYISLEVFKAMSVIALVVLVIATGSRLSAYLGDAAAGKMNSELLGLILFYRLPGLLELIIPVSFFLAIMIAHGRLAVDNELTVLRARDSASQAAQDDAVARVSHHDRDGYLGIMAKAACGDRYPSDQGGSEDMTEFDLLILVVFRP